LNGVNKGKIRVENFLTRLFVINITVKVLHKVLPITGHEGPEGE
jgi:hypothetical protein